jgi:formylglycine-generating enzyme required for sulfatase activity
MNGSKIGTETTMKKIKCHTCGEEKNIYCNPTGPQSGSSRVLRGGRWGSYARSLRSANRGSFGPGVRYYFVGFRLVRTPVSR